MDKGREIRIEGEGNVQCQGLPPDIKILASPKRGLESEHFQQRPHPFMISNLVDVFCQECRPDPKTHVLTSIFSFVNFNYLEN